MIRVTDLVEFLTARYDEDEAVARAATQLPCCEPLGWRAADRWSHRPRGLFTRDDTGGRAITLLTPDYPESTDSGVDLIRAEDGGIPLNVADHIVTWDPARVLADIAAKRRILARHSALHAIVEPVDGGQWCTHCGGWPCTHEGESVCTLCGYDDGCPDVRALASPYADHPDFRPEWHLDD